MTASITQTPGQAAELATAVEQALSGEAQSAVSDHDLARILTAAVKLYAIRAEDTGKFPAPVLMEKTTATEVVTTICEMIRAADLNMFDLSMWFQRAR